MVKLLLDGVVELSTLEFRITVDDLPPVIKPTWLPFSVTSYNEPRIDWAAVAFGSFLLVGSVASTFATYVVFNTRKELYFMLPIPQTSYLSTTAVYGIIVLCGLASLGLFLVALVLIAGIGLEGVLQRRPRFPLPKQLYSDPMPFFLKSSRNVEEKSNTTGA